MSKLKKFAFSGCCGLLLCVFAKGAYAQKEYPIEQCQRASGTCREQECQCKEWHIKLFTRAGTEWGLITGKTLASVQKQLKDSQQFDVRWAKFIGKAVEDELFNAQHPGPPTCVADCPSYSTTEKREDAAHRNRQDEASEYASEFIGRIGAEVTRIQATMLLAGRNPDNPYRNIGSVLRDYTNALTNAYRRLKDLRGVLAKTERVLYGTASMLERALADLTTSDNTLRTTYSALPDEVRSLLENRQSSPPGNGWKSEKIADTNGTIRQLIVIQDGKIQITLQAQQNNWARSYTLALGDLIEKQAVVQVTADRWVLTLYTDGRRISDVTQSSGEPIREVVSKVNLYFSTERAAREAAATFSSLAKSNARSR